MLAELPQNEFEQAKLHEGKIRQIETAVVSVRDLKALQATWDEVNLLLAEEKLNINSIVWERFLEWYQYDRDTICKIASNPNPSIPSKVFKQLVNMSFVYDENKLGTCDSLLFKSLCESKNPNFNANVWKIIYTKLTTYLKDIKPYKQSIIEDIDQRLKLRVDSLEQIFTALFSTPNQFAKWKDESGNHQFLQLLELDVYRKLQSIIGEDKMIELLKVLAGNSSVHTPDLAQKFLEFFKQAEKQGRSLLVGDMPLVVRSAKQMLEVKNVFLKSGSDCVPISLLRKNSHSTQITSSLDSTNKSVDLNLSNFGREEKVYLPHKTKKERYDHGPFGGSGFYDKKIYFDSEIFNLSTTFNNLLEALKFSRQQPKNTIPANTSVTLLTLREKLKGVSFEGLIDIRQESSIPRLLIDIANFISQLKPWQGFRNENIDEFERLLNSFRFDLIESTGIGSLAYQFSYIHSNILKVCFGDNPSREEIVEYYATKILLLTKIAELDKRKIIVQGHVQEGQNPKKLVEGLVQLQNILTQLQSKITKIPIVELTDEDKAFNENCQSIFESLERRVQKHPGQTWSDFHLAILPNEPIPEDVETGEWFQEYLEIEREREFDIKIKSLHDQNLDFARKLYRLFKPDDSIDIKLKEIDYSDKLELLWKKIQDIQVEFNDEKDQKTGNQDRWFQLQYTTFANPLLFDLKTAYKNICIELKMSTEFEKLDELSRAKIIEIEKYLDQDYPTQK
jgi:hypothetical protein